MGVGTNYCSRVIPGKLAQDSGRRGVVATVKLIPTFVERAYFAMVQPLVHWFIRNRVHPNTITTIGALIVLVSAVLYGAGLIRLGGLLLLLSGAWDTLDGAVARAAGKATKFGAFYDSTLDRVADGATFMGIAYFLLVAPDVAWRVPMALVCMVAIIASLLVSYARARAEGLGLDCKVGLVQRAERIVGLGVPTLIFGAGPRAVLIEAIVAALAVGSVVTVIQRFAYVYRVTGFERLPDKAAEPEPVVPASLAKGP